MKLFTFEIEVVVRGNWTTGKTESITVTTQVIANNENEARVIVEEIIDNPRARIKLLK